MPSIDQSIVGAFNYVATRVIVVVLSSLVAISAGWVFHCFTVNMEIVVLYGRMNRLVRTEDGLSVMIW